MKTLNMHWLIAAAALAVAAGSASAQTYKAEIPFSFRAGRATMLPGAYRIELLPSFSGAVLARVSNMDTSRSVTLFANVDLATPKTLKDVGKAVVAFNCNAEKCELTSLWSGGSDSSFRFIEPAHSRNEAQMASVNIALTKAE
jgi:hypothetical protein